MKSKLAPFSAAALALLFAAPAHASDSSSADVAATEAAVASARSPAEDCLAAANAGRDALLEGRAADLYGLLPPSWQKDVDAILRRLGEKVPEDLFVQITGLAGELAPFVDEKGGLVAEFLTARPKISESDVRTWGPALRALAEWKHEDLREGRFRALFGDDRFAPFLAFLFGRVMEEDGVSFGSFALKDPLQRDKVSLLITVTQRRFAGIDEETGRVDWEAVSEEGKLDWVRVEDRWVPDELASSSVTGQVGWDCLMHGLAESIDEIGPRDVGELSMGVTMLRMVLPKLRECQTVEDLERVLDTLD